MFPMPIIPKRTLFMIHGMVAETGAVYNAESCHEGLDLNVGRFHRGRGLARCGQSHATNFTGTFEGGVEMGANVLAADAVEKTAVVHDEQRLGMRRAEDEVFSFTAEFFVEVFERIQA